tara:strand:- start:520 stop:711 length:192 start_codon:yes stop_codon:yes gene_type:complete
MQDTEEHTKTLRKKKKSPQQEEERKEKRDERRERSRPKYGMYNSHPSRSSLMSNLSCITENKK